LVLLWFIVIDLEWEKFIALLSSFPKWKYLGGLSILCIVYLLKSLRWKLLNKSFGIETSWRDTLIFYLSAGFLSVITPGRLGEFAKIYFLQKKYHLDLFAATSSVILDRIWDVLVLSLAAGISVVVFVAEPSGNLLLVLMIGILFLISVILVLLPSLLFIPLLYLLRRFVSLHEKTANVYELWKKSRYSNFSTSLLISATSLLMLAFIPVLFSLGTSDQIPFFSGIGAVSVSNILSFLPVTIAGIGTRELVFVEVWQLNGHAKEIALSVSTAYFLITYVGTLLIGGLVYLGNLKQLYRLSDIRKLWNQN
jgi:uncharacterized protein (TIRG00374 family)